MCEWFDETCGALIKHIDESGIAEDTLVIYVTDNGWIQTETGGYGPRSKRSPYERGTRTPIMFRWPGVIPAADRPELCSSIDIVPTILAATGAEGPHEFPGLIGHYPWPKVTDGMYEDQEMPLPRLNDPAIYEAQPDFLKQSINRARYFWRWDTPEKYQTNMRAYFRMISGIDHVVGRLEAQLEEQGLADNTVIIYTADNGYYLGDRGFAGKWTHYEQSLRVPLIVHDPRLPDAKRGRVLSDMALNSDLASTMIGLAGLPVPDAHTGRSLVPLLEGKTVADWRTDVLCEFLAVPGSIPRWEGVRGTDWVYARYYVDGPDKPTFEFLHDLKNDPDQLINLALGPADELDEENASALVRLRARCDELVADYGPPMQELGK